jgi:glutamate decarboxylase
MQKYDSERIPLYGSDAMHGAAAKYQIPDEAIPPRTAYNMIHDELTLDGYSRLNLATFVTTWMEPEARQLMTESFDKNMIDKDEYPQTAEIEMRCVRILADLWNSPEAREATGCSTIGSSEAAMLGGMALKWRWKKRRQAAGEDASKPNLIMGSNVQVCWEKFCRYWEVEPRYVPVEGDRYHLSPELAAECCDENTIGVVAIMGSTFDGSYEPVEEVCQRLDALQEDTGLDIPVHVDAASGGFIAPFLQKDLVWDFQLERVKSINTSGHKYGLVYPGVGWIIWRDKEQLPEELVFHCSYLGGDLPNFALNFSRPGNQVLAQYYNFIRLGREGYTMIQQTCQDVALYLSGEIAKLGPFELISDGSDIPVFAWRIKEDLDTSFTLYDVAERLRERGWLVPAYPMPANREDLVVQRVVVKQGFSRDQAGLLLDDLRRVLEWFDERPEHKPVAEATGGSFAH